MSNLTKQESKKLEINVVLEDPSEYFLWNELAHRDCTCRISKRRLFINLNDFDILSQEIRVKESPSKDYEGSSDKEISFKETIAVHKETGLLCKILLMPTYHEPAKSFGGSFDISLNSSENTSDLTVYYQVGEHESAANLLKSFKCFIQPEMNEEIVEYRLGVVSKTSYGYETHTLPIDPIDLNIEENYNDDFLEVDKRVKEWLSNKNATGITLLHGMHGTGKSTYIHHLLTILAQTTKRNVLYIPPNVANYIADPEMISYISNNAGSLLVIEDAENVIKSRESGGNQAISNLLNFSDGLLSKAMKIPVIATFNTNIDKIDEALLRKNRLKVSYEFKKLDKVKAQKIADKLGLDAITEDTTLADLYGNTEKTLVPGSSTEE